MYITANVINMSKIKDVDIRNLFKYTSLIKNEIIYQ